VLHEEDGRLYLIVLTTLRLVPPGQVIDAIPQTTLASLGHTRKSACERLREPSFWQTAPSAAAAIVGDPFSPRTLRRQPRCARRNTTTRN
jgi:hypothetical protein